MMGERILHVLWSLEIGGAERAVYQLAREQRRQGVIADIAVASHGGLYGGRAREAGVEVHEIGQRHATDVAALARARSLFKGYHILHFHSAEPALLAMAARMKSRTYYTHRSGFFEYPWRQAVRYRLTGTVLRRSLSGLSANTQHAARTASALFRVPAASIATTYNGLDFSLLTPTRPPDAVRAELRDAGDAHADGPHLFRVATSGNLRAWKRIDLLLEAVSSTGEAARCYVIGDGPDRPRLETFARRLGVADRVFFTGRKENVADYLQIMDAFVLPSGTEESFGNSAVEAMATGLPTIVFHDGGGLVEHIRDGETGFIVDRVEGLAGVLARLAHDPPLCRDVGRAGAASVRSRYSVAQMLATYQRLYHVGRLASADG